MSSKGIFSCITFNLPVVQKIRAAMTSSECQCCDAFQSLYSQLVNCKVLTGLLVRFLW